MTLVSSAQSPCREPPQRLWFCSGFLQDTLPSSAVSPSREGLADRFALPPSGQKFSRYLVTGMQPFTSLYEFLVSDSFSPTHKRLQ